MLTREQQQAYEEQGYLLISGLIPEETAAAAEAAMWRLIDASPTEPDAWKGRPTVAQSYDSPELLACFTSEYLATAAQLAGDGSAATPGAASFRAPTRAYALNVFPREGPWEWPRLHLDHAIKEHGHKTFPRAFRIAAMTYLSDVEPHGGGTVVWPSSRRRVEALARSDPERFEMMWVLNQALREIDLGAPVELTPRRGDVLFYHYMCGHAGSMNISDWPRFALNTKW
jgi:ectoine hydroxylase-related dioxygenase (phytanoyl-CoA dioxygenase family)